MWSVGAQAACASFTIGLAEKTARTRANDPAKKTAVENAVFAFMAKYSLLPSEKKSEPSLKSCGFLRPPAGNLSRPPEAAAMRLTINLLKRSHPIAAGLHRNELF